jgi:ketosteroid isomerase-like protein
MAEVSIVEIAREFAARINRRDADLLAELMTEDHVFVDSMGGTMSGRDSMREGWIGYYEMVPDYWIKVEETMASGDVVIMLGSAGGTYSADGTLHAENRWETPAAWRAVIRGDRVAEWRVYADNEPIRAVIRRLSE